MPGNIAGGVRPVVARWTIHTTLKLESAARFGSEGNAATDMPIIRDSVTGDPLLPGATIAGALRNHLCDVLGGYYSNEAPQVAKLFGGRRGDDDGPQSPLIMFESYASGATSELRDGVSIDPATCTAANRLKFDMEVLPAGTEFPLRFDLIVGNAEEEQGLLAVLAKALGGLNDGGISLGTRRSRGLGRVSCAEWTVKRYGLDTAAGWIEWLTEPDAKPTAGAQTRDSIDTALLAAWPTFTKLNEDDDKRKRVIVKATLKPKSGILIRAPYIANDATGDHEPDAVHLSSGGNPIVSGTAATGPLRAQAVRIARVVLGDHGKARTLVENVFGPRPDKPGELLAASRLRVSENALDSSKAMRPTRITNDRFTQGVLTGAMVLEEVQYHGHFSLCLELRFGHNSTDDERMQQAGLVMLVLKDLLDSQIAIGGTSSVGRGVVTGTATIEGFPGRPEKFTIGENLAITDATALAAVNAAITALNPQIQEQQVG